MLLNTHKVGMNCFSYNYDEKVCARKGKWEVYEWRKSIVNQVETKSSEQMAGEEKVCYGELLLLWRI